jgi:hypothetical protein
MGAPKYYNGFQNRYKNFVNHSDSVTLDAMEDKENVEEKIHSGIKDESGSSSYYYQRESLARPDKYSDVREASKKSLRKVVALMNLEECGVT